MKRLDVERLEFEFGEGWCTEWHGAAAASRPC
jgi:hypothetical protein